MAWLCLVAGCFDHASQHVENAGISTAHAAALTKCLDEAIATRQTTNDADLAGDQYVACAEGADKKYGRHK